MRRSIAIASGFCRVRDGLGAWEGSSSQVSRPGLYIHKSAWSIRRTSARLPRAAEKRRSILVRFVPFPDSEIVKIRRLVLEEVRIAPRTNPRAAAAVIECQANETHHASCRFYGARHRGICAPGSYPFRPRGWRHPGASVGLSDNAPTRCLLRSRCGDLAATELPVLWRGNPRSTMLTKAGFERLLSQPFYHRLLVS